MARAGEAPLEHLVVDAGALIRLEQLHNRAERFYTVREVVSEVRDKNARALLERLPFELEVREPSAEALAAVIQFAKKTGDFTVLSMPDFKIMALTWMLHKETHGIADLRAEPLAPGETEDPAPPEQPAPEAASAADGQHGQHGQHGHQGAPKAPKSAWGTAKPGISWASAIAGKDADAGANADASAPQPPPAAAQPKAAASMWDDDDFAGVAGADEPSALEEAAGDDAKNGDSPAAEEWPSLADAAKVPLEPEEAALLEREREELRQQFERIAVQEKKRREQAAKRQAKQDRAQQKREAARAAAEAEALAAAETNRAAQATQPQMGSRLLGISGVRVDCGGPDDDKGGDEEEDDDDWISPANFGSVDPFAALNNGKAVHADASDAAPEFRVACVTTDFAMQNVMMQMRLRLLTLEGRAISNVRRYVLRCDACKTVCRQLDKRFCPACGNATMARLTYSIDPSGVMRYHFKKGRRVSTRGMRYSLHKPKGGRRGDILLAEDQLMMGWWGQQAKKKSTATSMFGEHVTESLGVKVQNQNALRIGYGRQNPNAAKGRERRGKKHKRRDKAPGHL